MEEKDKKKAVAREEEPRGEKHSRHSSTASYPERLVNPPQQGRTDQPRTKLPDHRPLPPVIFQRLKQAGLLDRPSGKKLRSSTMSTAPDSPAKPEIPTRGEDEDVQMITAEAANVVSNFGYAPRARGYEYPARPAMDPVPALRDNPAPRSAASPSVQLPDWLDTDRFFVMDTVADPQAMNNARAQVQGLFPRGLPIGTDQNESIMGVPWWHHLSGVFNLEAFLETEDWLTTEAIMSGLRMVLRDIQQHVFLSPQPHALRPDAPADSFPFHGRALVATAQSRRFWVIPINWDNTHWVALAYDQYRNAAMFMDSSPVRARTREIEQNFRRFLLHIGEGPERVDQLSFNIARVPRQTNEWHCGLAVIDSVRALIREESNSGFRGWASSSLTQSASGRFVGGLAQAESHLQERWLGWVRRELGHNEAESTRGGREPAQRYDDWATSKGIAVTPTPKKKAPEPQTPSRKLTSSMQKVKIDTDQPQTPTNPRYNLRSRRQTLASEPEASTDPSTALVVYNPPPEQVVYRYPRYSANERSISPTHLQEWRGWQYYLRRTGIVVTGSEAQRAREAGQRADAAEREERAKKRENR